MNIYLQIYNFLKQYKNIFYVLLIIIIIQNIINLLSVVFFGFIAGYIANNQILSFNNIKFLSNLEIDFNLFNINYLILFFGFTILLLSLINLFINFYSVKIKYKITKNYLKLNLTNIFNSNFDFFIKTNKGIITNSFVRELDKIGSGIVTFSRIIPLLFQSIVFTILPFFINFKITCYIYLVLLFISISMIPLTKFGNQLSISNTKTGNIFVNIFVELVNYKTILISQNKQSIFIEKVIDAYTNNSKYAIKSSTLDSAPQILFPAITIVILIFIFTALNIGNTNNNIIDFSMIVFSIFRLLPSLSAIYGSHLKLYTVGESFRQIEKIFNEAKFKFKTNGTKVVKSIKKISLSNIYYSIDTNNVILDNLCLNFEYGKINLIYGKSGSGKSTIINLITGYKKPNKGNILINDIDFNELDLNLYRNKISYLSQDIVVFNGTLRDNLTWFNLIKVSDDEIYDILHKLKLSHILNNKEHPLDIYLNDLSETISGGEKQRIALARCLLNNPDLLILDEATSALDQESSKLILDIIKKIAFKKLVIAISHDLNWLEADLNTINIFKKR